MPLLSRIYFNAVFGALGGILGWVLLSVFGRANFDQRKAGELFSQLLLGGALLGGSIGYFVVSVEAIRDRSWLRFVRLATYGTLLGAAGGAVGMVVADQVNYWLVSAIGPIRYTDAPFVKAMKFLGTVLTRGLGFLFLGCAVGVSEGIAARSLGKFSYGAVGGTLGGFVGGALFGLLYELAKGGGATTAFAGALGFFIMGACIGSLSALVRGVFQPASVRVLRGWQEGREYPLDKPDNTLGRDEHVDIALFRDMKVEKHHAVIRRAPGQSRYVLLNTGAPPGYTLVNDAPVAQSCELHDGDRIQLGNVVLRFQLRAAQQRARGRRAAPPVAVQPAPAGIRAP
jgi:hypothetical protein